MFGHMHKSHANGENIDHVHNSIYWYSNSGKRYTYNRTYMHRYVPTRSVELEQSSETISMSRGCQLRGTLSNSYWIILQNIFHYLFKYMFRYVKLDTTNITILQIQSNAFPKSQNNALIALPLLMSLYTVCRKCVRQVPVDRC